MNAEQPELSVVSSAESAVLPWCVSGMWKELVPIIVINIWVAGCYEHTVPREPVVIEDCGWGGDPEPARMTVEAGGPTTCALSEDGRVKCWGYNERGNLGYGHTEDIGDDETPADVDEIDIGGPVAQIANYGLAICVLLERGSVRCWGSGDNGNVGYGSTEYIGDDETPADVGDVDVGGAVIQIARGYEHTCAILANGRVRCWGMRMWLGIGRVTGIIGDDETPASVDFVDVGGVSVAIDAGEFHTCVLLDDGGLRCWGANRHGQLGINDPRFSGGEYLGDDEPPSSAGLVEVGGQIRQISAGGFHTCALLEGGRVRCWGESEFGQLGYGNTDSIGDDETPASAGDVVVGGPVHQISAGRAHTCAVLESGSVRCWGRGRHGVLGYGNEENIGDDETPSAAGDVPLGCRAWRVSAGTSQTCALLRNGAIRCWGWGGGGQLGYGNSEPIGDDETPASAGDVPVW